MTYITASVFALLLFLFFLFSKRETKKTTPQRTLPPEAGGAWPIVGHLHLLARSNPAHITLGNMADKYGPIFTIRLGMHKAIVVSNSELAKECFTTNDKAFANRPKAVATELMGYNYATFGLSPYGPYWRQARRITTHEFLSNHRLEMFKHIGESEVNTSIKETYDQLLVNNNKLMLVEMKRWFGNITLNTVFRMVVGKRFAWATTEDEDEGNDLRSRKAFIDFFTLAGKFVVSDALPYLRWLDLGGDERAMKKAAREMDHVLQGLLEVHKQRRVLSEVKNGHHDFMDVMLSVVIDNEEIFKENEEISSFDVDTITKATCLSLILGGIDTTAVTLTWALSLLLNNREALKKVQQELDLQVGKERQVKDSDMKNLIYLQAVIKETMRLYPAAPLSLPHESTEDCTLAGYHVPAGTRLLVNLAKIQRDSHVWPDPTEFHPERFLTTHKDINVRGQNFELIPFGSGRRICPGISLGMQLIQLTLATFLHAFDLSTPSAEPVDMVEKAGITSMKATPLEVHLIPRLLAPGYIVHN
ncbi:cytochrome P450 CYP82D47-like [Juglans microcarpa x Juglans regia]|uniref:cytochrome P450 CYP82D47-like n=1 Tax=Juglans microcarpa x Juglans regia TaxID=2249226 RepID=UPI001B7E511A|nr:cytochrome P450 CYP82D47-like [Juglans microcarpa x Juglans regia]